MDLPSPLFLPWGSQLDSRGATGHRLTNNPLLTPGIYLGSFSVFIIIGGNPFRDFAVVTEQRRVIFVSQDVMCHDGQAAAAGFDFNRLSQFVFLVVRSKIKFQFYEATVWTHWILFSEIVFHFKTMVIHWNQRTRVHESMLLSDWVSLGPQQNSWSKWRKRGLIWSKNLSQAGLILIPECPNHRAKGI